MMVKMVTGFELGGQASHPWGKGLEVVDAGARAHVRFAFQPRLAPGVYFLNAGVLGLSSVGEDLGEDYLHRILDAIPFRIEGSGTSMVTGQVDLRAGPGAEVAILSPRDRTRRGA